MLNASKPVGIFYPRDLKIMGDELKSCVKPTDTEIQRRHKAADVLREHVEPRGCARAGPR